MSNGIYVGMNGAAARAEQLESVADNLANAQTPGFKASRPAFEAFLPADVRVGGPADQVFTAAVATGLDLRPGSLQRTGEPLDVALEGENMLAVRTTSGGTAYTRNGRLSVDADGYMHAAGNLILNHAGEPIHVPPETTPTIRPDGTIFGGNVELDRIGIFRVQGQLAKAGDSLLIGGQSTKAEHDPDAKLRIGELELGNASALEAAVQMVSAQRNYETSMQAIETYKKLGERAGELGRVR